MKTLCRFSIPPPISLLLAVLQVGFLTTAARGQSWVTADDYQANTNYWTYGTTIAAGGSSNLFAAGTVTTTNGDFGESVYGVVRRSMNRGHTWEVVDTFLDWWQVKASIVSPAGVVVVVGEAIANSEAPHWLVRLSADGGSTWATADDYADSPWNRSGAVAVEVAADGTIYVAGNADSGNGGHWIVRQSIDQGNSWATVVDETFGHLTGMKLTSAGMFLTGFWGKLDASNNSIETWRVARSADHLASWSVVDDWLSLGSSSCQALGIAEDRKGNLVVAGVQRFGGGTRSDWVVRRSTDGGNTWTTTTTVTNGGFAGPVAGVVSNSAGAVLVASGWIVRTSHDGGLTWTATDASLPGLSGTGSGMVVDGAGSIYVVGDGYVFPGKPRWLVRKLPPAALIAAWQGTTFQLSWPASNTGFVLQAATTLSGGGDWHDSSAKVTTTNGQKVVTALGVAPAGFFRLRKP